MPAQATDYPSTTATANKVEVFKGATNVTIAGGSISAHTAMYEFNGDVQAPIENILVPQGGISTFENASGVYIGRGVEMDHGQLKIVHNSTTMALAMRAPAARVVNTRVAEHSLIPRPIPTPQMMITPPEMYWNGHTWTRAQPTKVRSRMARTNLRHADKRIFRE